MGLNLLDQLASLGISFISAIAVITFHEFAHAYTSWKFGDNLPGFHKKLNLNPASHVDIVGLIFMMYSGFGWGNPVETSPKYYKDKQKSTILVGLSGPITSFIMALLAIIPMAIIEQMSFSGTISLNPRIVKYLESFLYFIMIYGFNMAIVSLLPFKPYDGFMVWGKTIKPRTQFVIMQYQNIILTFFLLMIIISPSMLQGLVNLVVWIFKWSVTNIVKSIVMLLI